MTESPAGPSSTPAPSSAAIAGMRSLTNAIASKPAATRQSPRSPTSGEMPPPAASAANDKSSGFIVPRDRADHSLMGARTNDDVSLRRGRRAGGSNYRSMFRAIFESLEPVDIPATERRQVDRLGHHGNGRRSTRIAPRRGLGFLAALAD